MQWPMLNSSTERRLDGAAECGLRNAELVSVIVPMLNEVENIDALIDAIVEAVRLEVPFEILIADGGSTDGTLDRARRWEGIEDVRLIVCDGKNGLSGDVLKAAAHARGEIVVVMDGDWSHPPERIIALVQPILDESADMVVGSRFAPGGATPGWPVWRCILSRLGSALAWPLSDVNDPLSGFFAVGRRRLLTVDPSAKGFKIGLEIIAHGGSDLRVSEVPITFVDRVHGHSKIGIAQLTAYLSRLVVLAGGAISTGGAARFAVVGLIGMLVDILVFTGLSRAGFTLVTAHVASFTVATVTNYVLNSRWAFPASPSRVAEQTGSTCLRFLSVCLLALAVRGGVLAAASNNLELSPLVSILCAVGAAAVINYLGAAFYVFPFVNERVPREIRWRVAAIGVALYAVVLRFSFIGIVDLLPQEAYYWNYAQHLDIGYLDHPPMVAWLIWLGTTLFGHNEFGVRIAAWMSWFAMAYFSYRLALGLFGKSTAFVTVMLVAVLPSFFAAGFFMTPDAPLAAAWAGALYYSARALLDDQRNAWWGAGICFGLGLLSKYTIVLLAPAVLLFVLGDRRALRWLKRPEPYFSLVLALLIFSPVIVWNLDHELASFAFQGSRRLDGPFDFSLPTLLASVAVLLTPPIMIAAIDVLWNLMRRSASPRDDRGARVARFIVLFTLTPLAVFIAFSLIREVKFNWTAPLWLAVLPAISSVILSVTANGASAIPRWVRGRWKPMAIAMLGSYGLLLNYLVLGIPGVGYAVRLPTVPVAWSEFGGEAAALASEIHEVTGEEPFAIGIDAYHLASQLAFYGRNGSDVRVSSVGRGVLGQNSLMYGYWYGADALRGRSAVIVALRRSQIADLSLEKHFSVVGETKQRDVFKDGRPAGRFFYRVGFNFKGTVSAPSKREATLLADWR